MTICIDFDRMRPCWLQCCFEISLVAQRKSRSNCKLHLPISLSLKKQWPSQQIYKCVRFWQVPINKLILQCKKPMPLNRDFKFTHEFIITQLFSANWPNFIFEVLAIYPFSAPKIQKTYVRTTDISSICGNKFWSRITSWKTTRRRKDPKILYQTLCLKYTLQLCVRH